MKINYLILILLLQLYCLNVSSQERKIECYKVQEIINDRFGGSKTTYMVSDLRLISKVNLGSTNQRIITPVYKNESIQQKIIPTDQIKNNPDIINNKSNIDKKNNELETDNNTTKETNSKISITKTILEYTFLNPKNEIVEDSKADEVLLAKEIENFKKFAVIEDIANNPISKRQQYVYVRIFDNYKRVAEKGYKSIVLFRKLSDHFYFGNQMIKAVKWYEKLFEASKSRDTVYYYRYADALIKTGQVLKGKEMTGKFYQLTE
ncbi:hypothetical protein [Flavobacterium ovatum]|uniref:hypothetical protein n=1 Tax=Flavobacterium ovatum TaxID=1928857 RepID=UPI003450275F